MNILPTILSPKDLQNLSPDQLLLLAQDIRTTLINVTSKNGGHIGPNLGVVELTLALHKTFDFSPNHDLITFDVAHQGYVHKLLTGRQGEFFNNLRKSNGASGFLSRSESPFDHYGAGHAGTALSAALGFAKGRDLNHLDQNVIALIGDASLTCGITLEALNNIKSTTKRFILILNDNKWSIAPNVGALSSYLNDLITTPFYTKAHRDIKDLLSKIPGGSSIRSFLSKFKKHIKDYFAPSSIFEHFGLRYIGPIDGHDLPKLLEYLNFCKNFHDQPILLHVVTQKGKGYDIAIQNPEKFHGVGPYDPSTGNTLSPTPPPPPNYDSLFGHYLTHFAKSNPNIVAITAAMPAGTGLSTFKKELPNQYHDVGIAEEHAAIFAAGLAIQKLKPVCAIYSTFLQRSFDPIVHDVCLQNLNVFFCMDRAGLSPNDGPTHHGLFDIAYLRSIPNVVLMQPKDENELVQMLYTGLLHNGPIFMRYPRGASTGTPINPSPSPLTIGQAELLQSGHTITLFALGPMVHDALALAKKLLSEKNISCSVVNARFVKPLDTPLLQNLAQSSKLIVTLEDHVISGGLGSAVLETLSNLNIPTPVLRLGWPDQFIPHGSSVQDLRSKFGLSTQQMYQTILDNLPPESTLP